MEGLKETVTQLLSLKFFFGLFAMRTSMYYLDRGLRIGQAEYVATGRTYGSMSSNYTTMYSMYSRSHFYFACEVMLITFVYGLFTTQMGYLVMFFWPAWIVVASLLLSPWLFNPQSFRGPPLRALLRVHDVARGPTALTTRSAAARGPRGTATTCAPSASARAGCASSVVGRDLLPRIVLFAACGALDVSEWVPPPTRTVYTNTSEWVDGAWHNASVPTIVVDGRPGLATPNFRMLMLAECAGLFFSAASSSTASPTTASSAGAAAAEAVVARALLLHRAASGCASG